MRAMLARLSPHEETALRKVGFGSDDQLDRGHVRRLLQLQLIEWSGTGWRLTPLGNRRYNFLVYNRVEEAGGREEHVVARVVTH